MLKEIFSPSKKNLLIWIVILFISSPILLGIWQRSITTNDVSWPLWRNIAMGLFMSLNILGSFLQAPFFFVYNFFPTPSSLQLDIIISFAGIALNSYILASLISVIWQAHRKRELSKKNLLLYFAVWLFYIIASFVAYFIKNASFIVFIAAAVIATFVTLRFKEYPKKVFTVLCLLTVLFSMGALGETIKNFEENYCWDVSAKDENGVGVSYQAHMDCHKDFNLTKALRENYFRRLGG